MIQNSREIKVNSDQQKSCHFTDFLEEKCKLSLTQKNLFTLLLGENGLQFILITERKKKRKDNPILNWLFLNLSKVGKREYYMLFKLNILN